jgi:hypothetical protein
VYADGEYKVAQYGQWDGYPDCGGVGILRALRETTPADLLERAMACAVLTDEEAQDRWVECGADRDSEFVNMEVSDRMAAKYPTLQRNLGWGVIQHLIDSENVVPVQHSLEFAGDGLFCEWAYVVDLDSGTFEVYKGFCKTRHNGERFSHLQQEGNEYSPVTLVKTYNINELPTDEEFLADFSEDEDVTDVVDKAS